MSNTEGGLLSKSTYMDALQKLFLAFEIHSVEGIRACFEML
jgi:hypothetical protein